MNVLRTSSYVITVPIDNRQYLLMHGYSGAMDIVDSYIAKALANSEKAIDDDIANTEISQQLQKRAYLTTKTKEEEQQYVARLAKARLTKLCLSITKATHMNKTITLFISLLTALTIHAQQPTAAKHLTGILLDENQQPLPGAVVSALNSDSTCLATAVTDSLGGFKMQYTRQDIRLVASMLGYEKRYMTVKKDNDKSVTVALKPTANMIGEVVVSGRNMIRKDNRLMIYPTENIKKNSYDGYSTLNLIDVAGLDVDIFDQTVTTMGKATMLCINGREVKADEINTLNPQDIKRIDYYQNFDPKHPDAKAVIDFIIKNRDHGGMLYAKVDHNANIAKGNGLVDVKQYSGKSEYEVQLSGNYARYTPKEGTQSTTYMPFATGDVWKNTTYLPSSERNNESTLKSRRAINLKLLLVICDKNLCVLLSLAHFFESKISHSLFFAYGV